jgi:phytoene dehydrogenase-like protein
MVRIESQEGRGFTIHADPARLREELLQASPVDSATIEEYSQAVGKAKGVDATALILGGRLGMLRMLPLLGFVRKWAQVTAEQFSHRFQDPFLRKGMAVVQYGIKEAPMLVHLSLLAGLGKGDGGFPRGGSLTLARNIEARYRGLGGKVHYRSRVTGVLVEQGRAVGVRLEDGSEHRADIVVSAADGHATIYEMLGGAYLSERIREYYERSVPQMQEFGLEVFFGVARNLRQEPHAIALLLSAPMVVEGREVDRLDIELFSAEKGMAPEGKGVIKVVFPSSYDFWKRLREDRQAYESEKERVAKEVLARLDPRFPGLGSQVEAEDVMTPVTVERYLGAYRGLQAWPPKLDVGTLMREGLSPTLPGLSNFYMVGQYAQGMIGLSTAAAGGRKLVRRLCKEDGKRFQVRG